MNYTQFQKEILNSWKRCLEEGILKDITGASIYLEDNVLNDKKKNNALILDIFRDCVSKVNIFIKCDYCFLLTDVQRILLEKREKSKKKCIVNISEGAYLTEESCGTNAVDIALRIKKPVYIQAQHQYGSLFQGMHFYAVPIWGNGNMISCIAVISPAQHKINELMGITNLLTYQISSEFRNKYRNNERAGEDVITLSEKQLIILKLICAGNTDKALAVETGLSFGTIKYHKRNIFKKLNAGCSTEAIAKAIKLGLLEP